MGDRTLRAGEGSHSVQRGGLAEAGPVAACVSVETPLLAGPFFQVIGAASTRWQSPSAAKWAGFCGGQLLANGRVEPDEHAFEALTGHVLFGELAGWIRDLLRHQLERG